MRSFLFLLFVLNCCLSSLFAATLEKRVTEKYFQLLSDRSISLSIRDAGSARDKEFLEQARDCVANKVVKAVLRSKVDLARNFKKNYASFEHTKFKFVRDYFEQTYQETLGGIIFVESNLDSKIFFETFDSYATFFAPKREIDTVVVCPGSSREKKEVKIMVRQDEKLSRFAFEAIFGGELLVRIPHDFFVKPTAKMRSSLVHELRHAIDFRSGRDSLEKGVDRIAVAEEFEAEFEDLKKVWALQNYVASVARDAIQRAEDYQGVVLTIEEAKASVESELRTTYLIEGQRAQRAYFSKREQRAFYEQAHYLRSVENIGNERTLVEYLLGDVCFVRSRQFLQLGNRNRFSDGLYCQIRPDSIFESILGLVKNSVQKLDADE